MRQAIGQKPIELIGTGLPLALRYSGSGSNLIRAPIIGCNWSTLTDIAQAYAARLEKSSARERLWIYRIILAGSRLISTI